jgi:hypothetical protein
MADDQSRQPVRLVVAIPVRPFELRLAREPRSTDGATPVLLAQELSTTWRRRVPRPLAVTGLEGRLPGGIPGVGVARHLDMARRVDGLPHADARRTADRLGAPPGCPPWWGPARATSPRPVWCEGRPLAHRERRGQPQGSR